MAKLAQRRASRQGVRRAAREWGGRRSAPDSLLVAPVPVPAPIGHNRPPSDVELDAIPVAAHAEYDLSEVEIERLRRRLYARNKTGKFFYRTTRFGSLLAVTRFV